MSFLSLNGFPVPVADGSSKVQRVEIGESGRAFSGHTLCDVRALKRVITGRTSPLLPDDAKLIRALLSGDFDTISFDGVTYSGQGAPATAGGGSYEPWVAADGARVVGPTSRGYGRALWGTAAVTNLLTANQSDVETDTTGFSAYGGSTITRSSDRSWHGSYSLKVACGAGANDGTYCSTTAVGCSGAGQYFQGHVYLTGTGTVWVEMANNTRGRYGDAHNVVLTPDKWTRANVAVTADAAGDSLSILVMQETGQSSLTFYCDGFSVAKSNTPVPWCIGAGSTTALVTPTYPSTQLVTDEFSILGKLMILTDATAAYPTGSLVELNAGTIGSQAQQLLLTKGAGALTLTASLNVNSAASAIGTSPALTPATWTPFALTYSPQSTATRDKLQFFTGAGTGSNFMHTSPTLVIPASTFASLFVSPVGMLIDDVLILRHALTADHYASFVAGGDALLPARQLRVKGDLVAQQIPYPNADPSWMAGRGLVKGESGAQAYLGGAWHNDLAVIDFQIDEV